MKSMKGKLLKKMKSIKPITQLNPDRVLQVFAVDNIIEYLPKSMNLIQQTHNLLTKKEPEEEENKKLCSVFEIQEPEIIDVTELMRDLEEDEEEDMNSNDYINDKENINPQSKSKAKDPVFLKDSVLTKSEIDVLSFRRPDLNSHTLFDPNLLAAFEQAVKEHLRINEADRRTSWVKRENFDTNQQEHSLKQSTKEEALFEACSTVNNGEDDDRDPLLAFEEKCPPGGDGTVVFYTTTLRGIRKTFEDCSSIRFLLESFRVVFLERDVSMDQEYKNELWGIMDEKVVPPRLFIMGRYIGGAQEVLRLHEQGKLKPLFQNVPVDRFDGRCEGCGGFRFVICYKCNGSHKIVSDDGLSSKCVVCNENGLLKCPYCS